MEIDYSIYDTSGCSKLNDNIYTVFFFEIDRGIDCGDPNILKNAINTYKNNIDESYIKMAEKMYICLIEEKLENMKIN
tara:strand:- start:170 stop:403 length:234 start_codon:yes stop_codon:yes gene_type:complete